MNLFLAIYAAILFFLLTPSILVRLPKKGGKYTVAAIHAVVFSIVLYFTGGIIMKLLNGEYLFREGFNTESNGSLKFTNLANTYSDGCRGTTQYKSCPGIFHVGRLKFQPSKNTLTNAEITTLNSYKFISGKFSKTPGGASGDIKKIALNGSNFDASSSTSQAQVYIDSNKSDVFINLSNNIFGTVSEEYTLSKS